MAEIEAPAADRQTDVSQTTGCFRPGLSCRSIDRGRTWLLCCVEVGTLRRSVGGGVPEDREKTALEGTRIALAAVANLKTLLERLDRLMESGADALTLSKAVEALRAARRHADDTLRDAQEGADRALDAISDHSDVRSIASVRER